MGNTEKTCEERKIICEKQKKIEIPTNLVAARRSPLPQIVSFLKSSVLSPHHFLLQMYFSLNVTLLLFLAPFHTFSFLFSSPHFLGYRLPMKFQRKSSRKLQKIDVERLLRRYFQNLQFRRILDSVGRFLNDASRRLKPCGFVLAKYDE